MSWTEGKVFSKSAFLESETGRWSKQFLKGHLDALDRLRVLPFTGCGYGRIDYELNGEEWYLYPVMPEWCREETQTSLFNSE